MRTQPFRIMRRAAFALAGLSVLILSSGCGANKKDVEETRANADASPPKTLAAGAALPSFPPTSDPNAAMQRMVSAYKALNSFHVTLAGDIEISGIAPTHQMTTIRFQRQPGSLMLKSRDNLTGTTEFWANGTTLVWYSGVHNRYARYEQKGDLLKLASAVDKRAPQLMSPLNFLLSGETPQGVNALRFKAEETVNGKPAYVIAGSFTPAFMRSVGNSTRIAPDLQPAKGEFTVWLDKSSYLLLKHHSSMEWRGTVAEGAGRPPVTNPSLKVAELAQELVVNPTFAPDDFRFNPPDGAKEVFVERTSQ